MSIEACFDYIIDISNKFGVSTLTLEVLLDLTENEDEFISSDSKKALWVTLYGYCVLALTKYDPILYTNIELDRFTDDIQLENNDHILHGISSKLSMIGLDKSVFESYIKQCSSKKAINAHDGNRDLQPKLLSFILHNILNPLVDDQNNKSYTSGIQIDRSIHESYNDELIINCVTSVRSIMLALGIADPIFSLFLDMYESDTKSIKRLSKLKHTSYPFASFIGSDTPRRSTDMKISKCRNPGYMNVRASELLSVLGWLWSYHPETSPFERILKPLNFFLHNLQKYGHEIVEYIYQTPLNVVDNNNVMDNKNITTLESILAEKLNSKQSLDTTEVLNTQQMYCKTNTRLVRQKVSLITQTASLIQKSLNSSTNMLYNITQLLQQSNCTTVYDYLKKNQSNNNISQNSNQEPAFENSNELDDETSTSLISMLDTQLKIYTTILDSFISQYHNFVYAEVYEIKFWEWLESLQSTSQPTKGISPGYSHPNKLGHSCTYEYVSNNLLEILSWTPIFTNLLDSTSKVGVFLNQSDPILRLGILSIHSHTDTIESYLKSIYHTQNYPSKQSYDARPIKSQHQHLQSVSSLPKAEYISKMLQNIMLNLKQYILAHPSISTSMHFHINPTVMDNDKLTCMNNQIDIEPIEKILNEIVRKFPVRFEDIVFFK